ncbi:MAG: PQQ-dependent sugar dehydrogenase, partial [Spirochaetota bacterium]
NEVGRVRDVRIGPDGHLYFVTDAANGSLYRVDRAP